MADEPQDKNEKQPGRAPRRHPLDELEERLEKLRFLFEQHFLGNEKRPPTKVRDQLHRDIRRFDPGQNSAVERFRHQNLTARFVTYDTYWGRILRAIEEGTYERDRFKADLHERERKGAAAPAPTADPTRDERARTRAKDVGDEAAAFLASLGAGPAIGMRGRAVAEAPSNPGTTPAARNSEPGAVPPPAMRGQPVGASVGLRGAPIAPPPAARPTPPPAPAPPPAPPAPPAAPPLPMRGAPVGGAPVPLRGAPVGGAPVPLRGAPVGSPKPTGEPG